MTETAAAFERHLLEHLDDTTAWSAYADYLIEQGDPRGDFMRVQLALEDESLDKSARKALQQEEETLRVKHLGEWLGEEIVAEYFDAKGRPTEPKYNTFTFRRGWLWEARIHFSGITEENMIALTSWRWLHTLDVSFCEVLSVQSPFVRNLRALKVGGDEYHANTYIDDVEPFVAKVSPQLEKLFLPCGTVDTTVLFALPMVKLVELEVHCEKSYAVQVLADNPAFAALRTLSFHPHGYYVRVGDDDTGSYLNANDMRLICGSPHLAGLEHLQLNCLAGGDNAVRALIDSGRIFTLKSLNLTHGSVTDDGAQALANALRVTPHRLERLVLADNGLTPAGVAAFDGLPSIDLNAGEQHAPGDTEYLTQGDYE